jgi:Ca2+-transporting ATPase
LIPPPEPLGSARPTLQRIFDTVELDGNQWRACFIAVVGYFILAELGKLILRQVNSRRNA